MKIIINYTKLDLNEYDFVGQYLSTYINKFNNYLSSYICKNENTISIDVNSNYWKQKFCTNLQKNIYLICG